MRKNAHPFTDTVFATLFFSANKLPRTPDTTYGFYRKLVIIPFNANLNKVSLVDGAQFHARLMEDTEYIAYKAVLAIKNVLDTHQFIEPAISKRHYELCIKLKIVVSYLGYKLRRLHISHEGS